MKVKELKEICNSHKIELKEISPVKVGDKIVSSTAIRHAILNGDLSVVNSFLGEPYFISGEVVHGKKLGRVLGFPTANLEMKDKIYLPYGLYGGYVEIEGLQYKFSSKTFAGVTYEPSGTQANVGLGYKF